MNECRSLVPACTNAGLSGTHLLKHLTIFCDCELKPVYHPDIGLIDSTAIVSASDAPLLK